MGTGRQSPRPRLNAAENGKRPQTHRYTLPMDEDLHAAVRKAAYGSSMAITAWLREACREKIAREGGG